MPLIWGEMERGIFLLEGLDRANHVESAQQIGIFKRRIFARSAAPIQDSGVGPIILIQNWGGTGSL
jgi:hypothetical protein